MPDTPLHLANIVAHVLVGTVGIALGFVLLARPKGTAQHRRWGRWFAYATLGVNLTALIGSLFFRFLPIFATLNLLVTYQLVSGWRVIYTKAAGPSWVDAVWTGAAAIGAWVLVPIVLAHPDVAPSVVYASLGGLAVLLLYDTIRWVFPTKWHRVVWPYEHIYKLVASLFGMLSALVGNVVHIGQPWSQVVPSIMGVLVIVFFFARWAQSRPSVVPTDA
ncbi:MAG: hypothetical protein RhofKO_42910 [Rhodothermales bacterium]